MRLVKITTPVVFTTDIVELLLADGIAEVSLHGTSRMSGDGVHQECNVVEFEGSTPVAF